MSFYYQKRSSRLLSCLVRSHGVNKGHTKPMPRYIAFLRAINVGGRIVKMDYLRELFEGMGLSGVQTFIASGNVIFDSSKSASALATAIQASLQDALGYEVATFIRTPKEVATIAVYKPFSDLELEAAGALNVAFLASALDKTAQAKLMGLETDIDRFHHHGREVYWLCRTKQSESKFSNAVFERTLKVQATFRGISTVKKLALKYAD